MKPIKLEISAFGPYKDLVEIDFTKIGNSGIFLITGDTGTGKTTIFDAIVFALFGDVSGSNRQVSSIRSDFADVNQETYVRLEFSHKGKIYKVFRNPEYERPKKSGQGMTKNVADASLEYDDVVITGSTTVKTKVEEILGINVKQFKQISMLAQGEFLKILFAESKDRTEIFRKIFDTDIYNKITMKLKAKRSEAEDDLSQLKTSFITNSKNIKWQDEENEIKIEKEKDLNQLDVEKILEDLDKDIELKKVIEKEVQEKFDELEKENKKLELDYKKQEEENDKIDRLSSLNKKLEVLNQEETNIKHIEKAIDLNQKIRETVKPIEEVLEKTNKEVVDLKAKLENQNKVQLELEEQSKYFEVQEDNVKKLEDNYLKYQENQIEYKNIVEENDKLKQIGEKIKLKQELDIKVSKLDENKQKMNALKQDYDKFQELDKVIEESNEKLAKIEEVEKDIKTKGILGEGYNNANNEYQKDLQKYNEENDRYFKEQVGIIAETLKENEPCPVCGSIHHPNKATKSEVVYTKEMLNKLKKSVEDKAAMTDAVKQELTVLKSKIDTVLKSLEIEKEDELDKVKQEVKNKVSESVNLKHELVNKISVIYKELSSDIFNVKEFNFDKFKEKIDNDNQNLITEKAKLEASINDFINEIKNKYQVQDIKLYQENLRIKYENLTKVNNELKEKVISKYFDILNRQLNDIEHFDIKDFKERFKNKKEAYISQISESKTLIKEYDKNIKVRQEEQVNLEDKYKKAYISLGFKDKEEYLSNLLSEEDLKNKKEEVLNYNQSLIELKSTIKELSTSIKSKEKVDLDKIKETLSIKQEEFTKLKNELMIIKANLNNNINISKLLKENKDKFLKQIEVFMNYQDLEKTASGKLSGKKKIEFEQYVQAAYFDMIIIEANKRLVKMTDNRYQLVRKENASNLSEKIGLDLEVFDNYSGKKRDVKSLSGGESFKAALALSLGVSDVIQSYSGGVVVDTLFIDEGFGSLDTESREQAINTLNLLTDNNKLIGIISHITELKERIDKKIVIEKTQEGSKVKFEV